MKHGQRVSVVCGMVLAAVCGAGAAEYEKAYGHGLKGAATKGMDAQSLAHVFVAICILLGNVVQITKRPGGTA